jgi:hypothetical protein
MRESKQQLIIYFVNGPVPSADDYAAAKALGTKCFRNAKHPSNPPKDGCKAAGAVPANYLKAKNVTVVQVAAAPQASPPPKK